MDNKRAIEEMLYCHKTYRKSYLEDIISEDTKYEICNILMRKAINDYGGKGVSGTYNLEKDNIKLQKVLNINNTFKEKYNNDIDLIHMWEESLSLLLNCNTKIIDINKYAMFEIEKNKEFLNVGVIADKNLDKIELSKLKIKYMNKKEL